MIQNEVERCLQRAAKIQQVAVSVLHFKSAQPVVVVAPPRESEAPTDAFAPASEEEQLVESSIDVATAPNVETLPAAPPQPMVNRGVNRGAEVINIAAPEYPARAVRLGIEGTVRVNVEVLATGEVGVVQLMSSSGYEILDNAAIRAVRRARFAPAMNNGLAIRSSLIIPFEFQLRK